MINKYCNKNEKEDENDKAISDVENDRFVLHYGYDGCNRTSRHKVAGRI
jgi:hypothetical protein